MTHGASIGRSKAELVVRPPDDAPSTKHPIGEIDSVVLHGYAQITTQAINLCVDHDVAVHWVTASGWHTGSLTATAGQVQRRVRQYRALADEANCLRLARSLVRAKVEGQHRYLLRGTRGDAEEREAVLPHLVPFRSALGVARSGRRSRLAARAGRLGRGRLFSGAGPADQPDRSRIAALLHPEPPAAHGPVQRDIELRLCALAHGRDAGHPGFGPRAIAGFLSHARSAAYPLVLDLMELFRVPLWDMVVIGALNRGQWDPDADFTVTKAKVWLSDEGRKKAIGLFETRLDENWKHPVIGYSLSYSRTIELEARLLEKEWTGEPGLFARMRLR